MATTVAPSPVSTEPVAPSAPVAPATPVVAPEPVSGNQQETLADSFSKRMEAINNRPIPDADGTAASAPAQPTPVAPATGEAPSASSEPTGEIQSETGDVVMTAERNADGTFKTKIDPTQKFDITIKDAQTGKTTTYSKTVPELLRMAVDGVAANRQKDELAYYRTNIEGWQTTHKTMTANLAKVQADLDAQMELNRELLTAPDDQVVARRQEYAQQMSPEKQLARLQAELAAERAAKTKGEEERRTLETVSTFSNQRLVPHLAAAEAKIGPELVKMKLALDLVPFQVNGRVPPERLQALEAHLAGPFMQWVEAKAKELTTPSPAVKAAEDAVRAANARAQQVVNDTGRQIAPVGSVAGRDPATAQKPPKNIHEAIDRIVSRPIGS